MLDIIVKSTPSEEKEKKNTGSLLLASCVVHSLVKEDKNEKPLECSYAEKKGY
jgi:hypothetical protein